MNWIKAIPFVGTTISAGECIGAVFNGNFKEAGCKLVETCFDAAMDATVIASGGLASIITAPGKIAGKQAGKMVAGAAVKAVAGRAFAGVVADSIANKNSKRRYRNNYRSSSGSGSGSGSKSANEYTSNADDGKNKDQRKN